jgi:hypothetical protein
LTETGILERIPFMKTRIIRLISWSLALVISVSTTLAKPAAGKEDNEKSEKPAELTKAPVTTAASSASQTDDAEMMKQMIELSKLNENHKLLENLAGNWSYTIKMWMGDPNAKPTESTGTAVRKMAMEGRYLHGEYSGKFKMPGADGKMKEMNFKGNSLDGYDNVKKKFVSAWIDNMGTGIMLSEGTYDAATKTFTYTSEVEAMPGMKSRVRQVIKVADKDHHSMEYYEDRGQGEVKSLEINYTRKK